MDKVVVKTAVKTILIILAVLVVVFAVFNFAFPQHMASLTEKMGNYNLAVKYAALRYKYTRDGDDLARCFDDSVLLGNDKYIIEYGDALVSREDFPEICERKNARQGESYDYRSRALGRICVSYYNTGRKQEAVNKAAEANGMDSFAYGNPLMTLAAAVRTAKDAATCALLLDKLEKVTPQSAEETENLSEVKTFVKEVISQSG